MNDMPINVRIEHADGTHDPVEVVTQPDDPRTGEHVWRAIRPMRLVRGDHITADSIPANTRIDIPVARPAHR